MSKAISALAVWCTECFKTVPEISSKICLRCLFVPNWANADTSYLCLSLVMDGSLGWIPDSSLLYTIRCCTEWFLCVVLLDFNATVMDIVHLVVEGFHLSIITPFPSGNDGNLILPVKCTSVVPCSDPRPHWTLNSIVLHEWAFMYIHLRYAASSRFVTCLPLEPWNNNPHFTPIQRSTDLMFFHHHDHWESLQQTKKVFFRTLP